MELVVFLGNPGREYASTRHNAGFLLCDYLYPDASWQKKFHALWTREGRLGILKPQTYMNDSGISVGEAFSFFRLRPEEILVVHDDMELPFGTAKLQKGGGLQGHNGLRSIRERIGSDAFCRLRIGIGRPEHGNAAQFVLAPFTAEEKSGLDRLFPKLRSLFPDFSPIPQTVGI